MTTDDGGSAFPSPEQRDADGNGIFAAEYGMSLRDWFAGQALAMSASSYVNLPDSAALLAKRSYMVADAMLAARTERSP